MENTKLQIAIYHKNNTIALLTMKVKMYLILSTKIIMKKTKLTNPISIFLKALSRKSNLSKKMKKLHS